MKKFWVGVIVALAVWMFCLVTACYVFSKLESYKAEIARLCNLHNSQVKYMKEDIHIMFNRLNELESVQQGMEAELEKVSWWSCHRY